MAMAHPGIGAGADGMAGAAGTAGDPITAGVGAGTHLGMTPGTAMVGGIPPGDGTIPYTRYLRMPNAARWAVGTRVAEAADSGLRRAELQEEVQAKWTLPMAVDSMPEARSAAIVPSAMSVVTGL